MLKSVGNVALTADISKLERFSVHALESVLRGDQWTSSLESFFSTNSPRFRGFRTICATDRSGAGLDVQMSVVHAEFITLVEGKILSILAEMEVDVSTFLGSVKLNMNLNDDVVHRLYHVLSQYFDFVEFGSMMETRYEELYIPSSTQALIMDDSLENSAESHGQSLVTASFPIANAVTASPASVKAESSIGGVRVLWDVENIPIQKKHGGLRTVKRLHDFLQSKSLMGPGIDARITAFFNPSTSSMSMKTIEELDKAAVEIVWVSRKREDADRKLGMRINQEMQVLHPASTTFVIISSDQDFRHRIQLLQNAGFRVVVFHDARGGKWTQSLELHASAAYNWSDEIVRHVAHDVQHQSKSVSLGSDEEFEGGDGNSYHGSGQGGRVPVAPSTGRGGRGPQHHKHKHRHHDKHSNATQLRAEQGEGSGGTMSDAAVVAHVSCANAIPISSEAAAFEIDRDFDAAAAATATATASQSIGAQQGNYSFPSTNKSSAGVKDLRDAPEKEARAAGWRVAVCSRWQAAYGFVMVDISHPAVNEQFSLATSPDASPRGSAAANRSIDVSPKNAANTVRVYVHHTALQFTVPGVGKKRQLHRGDYVLAQVALGDRGPKAIAVKELVKPQSQLLSTQSSGSGSSGSEHAVSDRIELISPPVEGSGECGAHDDGKLTDAAGIGS